MAENKGWTIWVGSVDSDKGSVFVALLALSPSETAPLCIMSLPQSLVFMGKGYSPWKLFHSSGARPV